MRFLEGVALKCDGGDCLPWPFAAHRGYGTIGRLRVNRVVCERAHGPPPTTEHQAAHSCGNPRCVNPAHIRWATPKENIADKLTHGTHNRGERSGKAKLTADHVREIRALKGQKSQYEIAAMFGITHSAVDLILAGKRWAHL